MKFILFIESSVLIVCAVLLWLRTRTERPRFARSFSFLTVALLSQVGLLLSVDPLIGWTRAGENPADRLTIAVLGIAAIQVLRTVLLAWAVRSWLQVVKPRLVRSWRGVLILFCLIMIAFQQDATVAGALVMIPALLRLKWTEHIHGWGRLGLIFAFGLLTIALTTNVDVTVTNGVLGQTNIFLGTGGAPTILQGDLPPPAATIMNLSQPWSHAVRVSLVLLRMAILVGFFQLLVLPIRLRGLSLKRRFTVTLAMYRFIPGTLAFIFMILIVYLGNGLHRASIVRHTFENTLQEGLRTAGLLLSVRTATGTYHPGDARTLMAAGDRWYTNPSNRSYAVIRHMQRTVTVPDSAGTGENLEMWEPIKQTASPGTPQVIVDSNFFADIQADSAIGLVEKNGALYLRAALMRRNGGGGLGSEVFVAMDSLYLSRIAAKIHSDIRVDVSPNILIGESTVSLGGGEDDAWADSAFVIEAPFVRTVTRRDFWERKFYLARTFVPAGNWLQSLGSENRIGAIQLKLYTSPRALFESFTGSTLTFASQAFAITIFAAIGLLFLFVELSAVRTGRSIIKGILTDAKALSEAAKKFGKGDLQHRISLSGRDEMGRLAATFNTMASNIEEHQQVMLEKERLEADLAVARDIQQRMLPQHPPLIPGLDIAGISIPSREVGGDLFYFLPVADGRLGLTIGDVSGKSVPAALLMSNVLAALKSEARIVDREDEILNHINQLIFDQVEPGRFITFFYGVIDPERRSLRYACAGHNPPLLMRRSGEALWLHEAGVPLGVIPNNHYESVETALEVGDVLVLYSDGVTEAQRFEETPKERSQEQPAKEDEFFDEHRLEAAVRDARDKNAGEIIRHVMDAIQHFTKGSEQSDDLTLVVTRVTWNSNT